MREEGVMKKKLTCTEITMRQIQRDIILGKYRPGAKLVIVNLKQDYGVSLSVVREALTRLTEQELVTLTPNIGFSVVRISRQEIEELKVARLINEGEAIRLAIEHGSDQWIQSVRAAYQKLAQTSFSSPETHQLSLEWYEAHRAFHQAIVAGARNQFLSKICLRLWNQSELSRNQELVQGRVMPGLEEHQQLTRAIAARDLEGAMAIHRVHLNNGASGQQRWISREEACSTT